MGAAWRDTIGRKTNFNQILEYVKEIRGMGMEVCCTLGMLEKQQALELKKASLTAYNHNLDTSSEYYPNIISTRTYDERLQTLEHVREAGINVCSGGITWLARQRKTELDCYIHWPLSLRTQRVFPLMHWLLFKAHPWKIKSQWKYGNWEIIRMIAAARTVMPKAMVMLSAGRVRFTMPEQALCFLAGANTIFTGEKLLTTINNDYDADQMMFKLLGLIPKAPDFSESSGKDYEPENIEVAASASG